MTEADEETTLSIYWQMLAELESHIDDKDAVLKFIIEGAYRHYGKITGKARIPDHVRRNGGKWLSGFNGKSE